MLSRRHWVRRISELDPEVDHEEIYRLLVAREFPWDLEQALELALFRTYAVPSIGGLLARTGEFTERTQRRFDDTGLILEAVGEHGFDSVTGRAAVRRMNQMHQHWRIPQDDLRYVLTTFVTVPIRWIEAYGYRPLSEIERTATANYYRRLGRLMGIRDIPATWREFGEAMDAYEVERFGRDDGAVAVSEATLRLQAGFPLFRPLPRWLVRRVQLSLMDDRLLEAFGYTAPAEGALYRAALRVRGRVLRFFPARRDEWHFRDLPQVRSYPEGYRVEELGTFAPGCPHALGAAGDVHEPAPW
ncbi:DUF2236 domain-containing protein [Nocardioides mangrovicus]|uniref:DUF2236 domain-containing protein n=1 Tax=Nocardioides mangrovicus TaxID=2478913 RepID=A0A3L8NZP2_9ACTN|nr:oxygenase MpaB family protein [Nocardioides mangrovicus]RLV47568.1 DUF2236 domain-containing protein [Nocardioides mangrovicus]